MNRLWTILMGVAVLIMLGVFIYEFAVSLSGGNVTFSKTVNPIEGSLGTSNFLTFDHNFDNILIKTEYLDDK